MLNRRVDLHAIDATPARWRGDAGSSDEHPTHPLISTQPIAVRNHVHVRRDGLAVRQSQHGRVLAEKGMSEELSGAPDALVDFHTVVDACVVVVSVVESSMFLYSRSLMSRFAPKAWRCV